MCKSFPDDQILKNSGSKLKGTEIRRKVLHLIALAIPFGILYLPRPAAVSLLVPLAAAMLAGELLRRKYPFLQNLFLKIFGMFIRSREKEEITGGTYFFIAGAICLLIFDRPIAFTVMAFIILGDAAAALAGMKFGRLRTPWGKSVEGALASLLACISFWALFPEIDFAPAFAGAMITGVLEFLPLKINDNLFVPVVCGLVLQTWAGW
ncbi:MAG: diacylglycerol/polyprenol kinase family protein [Desulfosalsimonas sp.]